MAMTDKEIIGLITEMLEQNEIGLYPERHNDGADCYTCPSCGQSTDIMGYSSGMGSLDSYGPQAHKPDCRAMKLFAAIRERKAEESGEVSEIAGHTEAAIAAEVGRIRLRILPASRA